MGARIRVGPFSVSSRGRVGARVGPVSVYGGGRRRRSSSGGSSEAAGCIGFLIVLAVVVIAVMWPLSLLGHALGLTPTWHQLMNRNHVWEHRHYPLVGLRYVAVFAIFCAGLFVIVWPMAVRNSRRTAEQRRVATEQATERAAEARRAAAVQAGEERRRADERARLAAEAHAAWLAGPPPLLVLPGRFTQNWIAENVPQLHPGQIPVLIEEMHRRGWSDADIARRVRAYLPAGQS
jgi:hypothetical protein